MSKGVSIKAHFEIPTGDGIHSVDHHFDDSNTKEAIIGVDEPKKPQAGDYSYSGMHDQGPLPKSKEGGPYTQLIGCLEKAKTESDMFLTNVIKEEKKSANKKDYQ